MLNLCCLKSLFRLSFCIPGQPLPLPPMIESKASYGAILLHQYISLWDVLPALLQVVTPLLMHPRPKRHHLLGAKGNLCSAFLSHEDEVGEFFAKDMQRQQIFYLAFSTATSVPLELQFCKSLAPFSGTLV